MKSLIFIFIKTVTFEFFFKLNILAKRLLYIIFKKVLYTNSFKVSLNEITLILNFCIQKPLYLNFLIGKSLILKIFLEKIVKSFPHKNPVISFPQKKLLYLTFCTNKTVTLEVCYIKNSFF